MVKLATFCQECSFYSCGSGKCQTGALEKFIQIGTQVEYTSDENRYPVIPRICPYRRTDLQHEEFDGEDYLAHVVTNEVYIAGSIVLIAENLDDLQRTIDRLSQVKRIDRFKIVVAHPSSLMAKDVMQVCNDCLTFTEYTCVKSWLAEPQQIILEAFKRSKNGYMFILDASKDFDVLMIDKLNKLVNIELMPVLHVKPVDDSYHQSVTMSVIYRTLNGDCGLRVSEKIEEIMQEENVSSKILTWEQIDEYCC